MISKTDIYIFVFAAAGGGLLWAASELNLLPAREFKPDSSSRISRTADTLPAPADSFVTISIAAAGDLMCNAAMFENARNGMDGYDFRPVFAEMKDKISAADFAIGNLETTLGGPERGYSGFPLFNSPDAYAAAIADAGFDFLMTANNHCMDTGDKGLQRTIRVLDSLGMGHTGTYLSKEDSDSIRIVNIGGIGIALLSYTWSTNKIPLPRNKPWAVSHIHLRRITEQIAEARADTSVDLVLVMFHNGTEYERLPSGYQKDVVNHTIASGADIILGAHPHVVQPAHFFETDSACLSRGFAAYSLGNFVSNQAARYCDSGVLLHLEITRNIFTDSIWISDVSVTPTWVYQGHNKLKKMHVVYPAQVILQDTLPPWITPWDSLKLSQALTDVCGIMGYADSTLRLKPADEFR